MAPFETLVMTTVGDIFFVHERGWRSALFGFSIIAGESALVRTPTHRLRSLRCSSPRRQHYAYCERLRD